MGFPQYNTKIFVPIFADETKIYRKVTEEQDRQQQFKRRRSAGPASPGSGASPHFGRRTGLSLPVTGAAWTMTM